VKVIELVLRSVDSPDRAAWPQLGRMEAGSSKVSFRSSAPAAGDPPQKQAELIRRAATRGASALIVEAEPDPRVAEALQEVKSRGTPVVLLARPLPGHEQDFPLVTVEPPIEAAHSLVKAAIEDAKTAKLPSDGTAVILAPKTPDVFSDDQLAALKTAIGQAGIATPEVIPYDGSQSDAVKIVNERLKSDTKLTLVFALDSEALLGALSAREGVKKERKLIVAGFGDADHYMGQTLYNQAAGVANRDLGPMFRTALRLAVRLANGEQVEQRTAIPISFRRYSSQDAPEPERRR